MSRDVFSTFQGGGKGRGGGWAGQEAVNVVSRAEQLRGEAAAIFFFNSSVILFFIRNWK